MTFTPPTFNVPWRDEGRKDRRFWRFYDGIPTGYSVLITGGTVSTYPGVVSPSTDDIAAADSGSGEGGKAAFLGGHVYTVTSSEQTALEAAGYTVT